MEKQEAINKAYGFLNQFIDSDGWATYGCAENSEFGIEPFGEYETRNHVDAVYEWRPKSLQGIENNNGWIKIESEADLPKEYKFYWIKTQLNSEFIAWCRPNERLFIHNDGETEFKYITHYQPIQKPLKPLY